MIRNFMSYRASFAVSLIAGSTLHVAADTFVWSPACDTLWQGCCPLGADLMQNNWNRTSPAPVCPAQPTANDTVTIAGDCIVGPPPLAPVAAGTLNQSGGTFTLNHGLSVAAGTFNGPFVWNVGEIARGGGVPDQFAQLNGGLTISGSEPKTLSFFGAFSLINTAEAIWGGSGALTIGMTPGGCCPSILRNAAGAEFSVQTDAAILATAFGLGRIENFGTILKENSNGQSAWNAELFNSGLVHVKTGELRLLGGGSTDGDFVVDPGATLTFAGIPTTLLPGVNISGAGQAIVADSIGTSLTINDTVTLGRLTVAPTGRIGGTGWMQISELLTMQNAADLSVNTRILPGGRLEFPGIAQFRFRQLEIGGLVRIVGGATLNAQDTPFTILTGGEIQLDDGGLLQPSGNGVQPVNNHGTIRKMPGSGSATIASSFQWFLNNHADGRIQVDQGELICINRLDSFGEINIAAGAAFKQQSWGNYHPGTTIAGGGWFHLDSGQNNFVDDGFTLVIPRFRLSGNFNAGHGISGPGAVTIVHEADLRGGAIYGPLATFQTGAIVNVNGPNPSGAYGTVENFAAVHSNAADFVYGTFNNRSGGSVELHGDYYFGGRFGGTLNNEGTLRKSGGSGDSDFGGRINNNGGQIIVQTGRIVMNELIQSAGTIQLFGTGIRSPNLVLNGGLLTGAAALTANVTNNGGVFEPGGPTAGLVTISGDAGVFSLYSQNAGGSLRMQIGGATPGTAHDQIQAATNFSLNGGLNLQLINGFQPNVGDSFTIMTCGGLRSGTFTRVSGTQLPGGKQFVVQYNSNSVVLSVVSNGGIVGDLDGSGSVGLQDLSILLSSFGACDGEANFAPAADINGDGCVGLQDLATLLSNFGA